MSSRGRGREILSEEEKKKRRREQKKISMQRARAKMSEAELQERREKDRERYRKKKEKGLIKTIKDFTPRQQRRMRKLWREKAVKAREKKKNMKNALHFIENRTPPKNLIRYFASPTFSRVKAGRKVRLRNRRRLKAANDKLKNEVHKLRSALAKYRMRFFRRSKKLRKILSEIPTPCKEKTRIEKRIINAVRDFLLQDEQSRLTSGKKETITRRKVKKQIRFLNDSLLNLHKAFVNKTGIQITYETFRKHRPFWVLFPKVNSRNTCLCALHTNTDFIVRALNNAKIIPYRTATDLIKCLCCNNSLNVSCLDQRCPNCSNKSIETTNYNDNDTILYERRITKNVVVVIKGQSKTCRKTLKETVHTTKKSLTEMLSSNLPIFMKHVANMLHQMKTVQTLKQNLCPDHGLLHIDFSENYNCKYGAEVQSAHFGGSKGQISLHTSVYYSTDSEPVDNFIKTTSFCTATDNLNHDPVMICVHLDALVNRILELSPNLKHLHILSDGPLTQYRNKTMFHLIATFLSERFGVETLTWHYSEKGHGKGALDGVGGCIKRICDNSVAQGESIPDLQAFMSCLNTNCKGIQIYPISESLVSEVQQKANLSSTKPFKGTLNIHQLTWSSIEPRIIHARRLSCLVCAAHAICPHYEIGQIHIQIVTQNSPRLEENIEVEIAEVAAESDSSREKLGGFHHRPMSPNTSSASTKSNSPGFSDRITPDVSTVVHNRRPEKRSRAIFDSDSDSHMSLGFSRRSITPQPGTDSNDSDSIIVRGLPKRVRKEALSDTDSDE